MYDLIQPPWRVSSPQNLTYRHICIHISNHYIFIYGQTAFEQLRNTWEAVHLCIYSIYTYWTVICQTRFQELKNWTCTNFQEYPPWQNVYPPLFKWSQTSNNLKDTLRRVGEPCPAILQQQRTCVLGSLLGVQERNLCTIRWRIKTVL